jgi:hypothetical protein
MVLRLHNRKLYYSLYVQAPAQQTEENFSYVSVLLDTLSMQAAALAVNVSLSNKELHSRPETIVHFTANQIQ